ncbi:MAG: tyrosine-type recombinase/integrase [Magnetospirillum sp.]|nr:tyrosine-type recombinase/integrase [Magnetospirillum sp.]
MCPSHANTVDDFMEAARSAATKRGYASDWRDFSAWCHDVGERPLPAAPAAVGRYLAARAGDLKPSTLKRRLAAIIVAHRAAGYALDGRTPAIADVLAGIRRTLGTAPAQKEALSTEDIGLMASVQPPSLTGLRDRAVILLGFAGAFRRSELAALTTRDLLWTSDGLAVTVRRGKEDQDGTGHLKAIPFAATDTMCPVRAVRAWVLTAKLDDGPLFRRIDRHGNLFADGLSGEAVAQIVMKAIERVGRQNGWCRAEIAARKAGVAGHSLRAGLITSAARAGVAEWAIMQHTGQKQISTLRGYIRRGEMFDTSPLTGIPGWSDEGKPR